MDARGYSKIGTSIKNDDGPLLVFGFEAYVQSERNQIGIDEIPSA